MDDANDAVSSVFIAAVVAISPTAIVYARVVFMSRSR